MTKTNAPAPLRTRVLPLRTAAARPSGKPAAPAQAKELTIVTVTYRSADAAKQCLRSLVTDGLLGPRAPCDVHVVDSGSGDGTAESLAATFPWAKVTALADNVGFARGCNVAMRASRSPYVLLLNPDCVVPPGSVAAMMAYLRRNPRVAAVGPSLLDDHGNPAQSCQAFPTPARFVARRFARVATMFGFDDDGRIAPRSPCAVDWISGACMLIRREAIETVGLLDESYFLYFEETDWCLRARRSGWSVHHHPWVRVFHSGGKSAAVSGEKVLSGAVARHFVASRRRYFRTHHGLAGMAVVEAAAALRSLVDRLRSAAGRSGAGVCA